MIFFKHLLDTKVFMELPCMMDHCLEVQLMTALVLMFFAYDGLLNLNHMDKPDLSLDVYG